MLINNHFCLFSLVAATILILGNCVPDNRTPCDTYLDCGIRGNSICISGYCRFFNSDNQFAEAKVDLTFKRGLEGIASNCQIFFLHAKLSNGEKLSCDSFFGNYPDLDEQYYNHLRLEPKYLVLNWTGGSVFLDNIVQLIRPAEEAIVIVLGFSKLDAQGEITAVGCKDSVDGNKLVIKALEQIDLGITVQVP